MMSLNDFLYEIMIYLDPTLNPWKWMIYNDFLYEIMIYLDPTLNPWKWMIYGAFLLLLEIALPTLFFLWPGLAAIFVGIICLFVPLGIKTQIFLFVIAGVASVVLFYKRLKSLRGNNSTPAETTSLHLSDRMLGRYFVLDKPMVNGRGRIMIDGIWWTISGSDHPAGTPLHVINTDATILCVAERHEAPPPDNPPK